MFKRILFVVGASGTGKTTALRQLEQRRLAAVLIRHFDSIGVPTAEAMALTHGGMDGWQACATAEWIRRLVQENGELFVIEGQTRPREGKPTRFDFLQWTPRHSPRLKWPIESRRSWSH